MKKHFYAAVLALATAASFSQTLQEIITKTENENFESAARDFRALIAKDPNKGEYYFYYGENFFKRDDSFIDSANVFYTKGSEVNATYPLNYVGLGKVLLFKGNVNDAKTMFYKAVTLGANKNAEVYRKIAEAWLVTDNKNPDEAINLLNTAIKLDPKNPENYILLGDAQLEKNPSDGSGPIKNYKMATSLNPKSTKGILREGKLYQRGRNYQLALEKYKEAEAIDPNFAPAFREKAELYFLYQQPAKSIENWKKYLELNNSDYARYRFFSALYKNKQYNDAINEYESLKKTNYKNVYLERLAGYSYEEIGDKTDKAASTKGLEAISKFFKDAGSDFKYIALDYKYKGFLMIKGGKDTTGGIAEIEKAIAMDPSIADDAYGKLGKIFMDTKNYDKAIYYYEKKRNGDYKKLNINDCFDLGKAGYSKASKESRAINQEIEELKKKKKQETPELIDRSAKNKIMLLKSDSAFKRVVQLNQGYILGYIWRGRVNSLLDPNVESDSTKTYYDKAFELMKPEEREGTYKSNVIEILEYQGFYHVKRKDDVKAKEIWKRVLELDPANEKAKFYLNPPKPAAPAKPAK